MPTTRSASRAVAQPEQQGGLPHPDQREKIAPAGGKRKATVTKADSKKKARTTEDASLASIAEPVPVTTSQRVVNSVSGTLVPAKLTFSFEDAKQHLIGVDARFESMFNLMPCKPFEHLEQVDPFRTLTHSILGQQISWLAARSITHKFVRLFDPSLPEKPTDHYKPTDFFPSAHQVAIMDVPTLRSAGLSQRKAEYVRDLAARFVDGRLSTQKVMEANDDELYEMLIEVRGIGRWTVDMFAIFSLRRPDILPVGDLGVQRGLLRWFLSLHSPTYNFTLSPQKLPGVRASDDQTNAPTATKSSGSKTAVDPDVLPSLGQTSAVVEENEKPDNVGVSSIPPIPALPSTPAPRDRKGKKKSVANDVDSHDEDSGVLPTPFTPSINKTLNMTLTSARVPPLPAGLTASGLKKRLEKKIKGAFLTPKEMENVTEHWRPYRSLGVYYMWALAEEAK